LDKTIVIIGVLVIAILVIVAIFTLGSAKPASNATNPAIVSTIASASSVQPANVSQQPAIVPASPASAGVSKLFITQSNMTPILGSSVSYGAYERTTPAQLQSGIPPAFLAYNVVAEYNMTYNATTPAGSGNILAEVIFPTNTPALLYSYVLSQYPYFNATLITRQGANVINNSINATLPGFTYSSSSFVANSPVYNPATNTNSPRTVLFQVMLGYTRSDVALVSILMVNGTVGVNATRLALLTSQNLNRS
jgi:hypothetical protein